LTFFVNPDPYLEICKQAIHLIITENNLLSKYQRPGCFSSFLILLLEINLLVTRWGLAGAKLDIGNFRILGNIRRPIIIIDWSPLGQVTEHQSYLIMRLSYENYKFRGDPSESDLN